jgi:hypothetical protein
MISGKRAPRDIYEIRIDCATEFRVVANKAAVVNRCGRCIKGTTRTACTVVDKRTVVDDYRVFHGNRSPVRVAYFTAVLQEGAA